MKGLTLTTKFVLSDGFLDDSDPKFHAKISTYLDFINICGFSSANIAIKPSADRSVLTDSIYFSDLVVFNSYLKPIILVDIKHPNEFEGYLKGTYKTSLFDIAREAEDDEYIKNLILIYSDNSGYVVQKEPVVIDYRKYKTYGSWVKSKFEHSDLLPMNG